MTHSLAYCLLRCNFFHTLCLEYAFYDLLPKSGKLSNKFTGANVQDLSKLFAQSYLFDLVEQTQKNTTRSLQEYVSNK